MKAPLRYAFGWVLFVAIFAALNPIVSAIFDALAHQALVVSVITVALSLVAFTALFFLFLSRFYGWLDSPRLRVSPGQKVPDKDAL